MVRLLLACIIGAEGGGGCLGQKHVIIGTDGHWGAYI